MCLVMVDEDAILEGAHDEVTPVIRQSSQQRVRVALAIHHVDGLCPAAQKCLSVIDAVKPSGPFTAALRTRPVLVADRLVEPKDRLECQQTKRDSRAVGAEGEREVSKETLRCRPNRSAEALALRVSGEFELCGVVHDQHTLVLGRPTS